MIWKKNRASKWEWRGRSGPFLTHTHTHTNIVKSVPSHQMTLNISHKTQLK